MPELEICRFGLGLLWSLT